MKILILALAFPLFSFANDRVLIIEGQTQQEILELLAGLPTEKAKFAISGSTLAISTTGEKSPRHDDLAIYGEVITGGYISLLFEGDQITTIKLDNYSGRLCPTYKSLLQSFEILAPVLSPGTSLILMNNPNLEKCD